MPSSIWPRPSNTIPGTVAEFLVQSAIITGSQSLFDQAFAYLIAALRIDPTNVSAIRARTKLLKLRNASAATGDDRDELGRRASIDWGRASWNWTMPVEPSANHSSRAATAAVAATPPAAFHAVLKGSRSRPCQPALPPLLKLQPLDQPHLLRPRPVSAAGARARARGRPRYRYSKGGLKQRIARRMKTLLSCTQVRRSRPMLKRFRDDDFVLDLDADPPPVEDTDVPEAAVVTENFSALATKSVPVPKKHTPAPVPPPPVRQTLPAAPDASAPAAASPLQPQRTLKT